MFDIGWTELLVIGIVTLIVVGPKELPALLRTLGNGMSKLRRMASEFQSQFNDAMREAELDELRKQAEKLSQDVASSVNPLEKAASDVQSSIDAPPYPTANPAPQTSSTDMDAGVPTASEPAASSEPASNPAEAPAAPQPDDSATSAPGQRAAGGRGA
jgi:sec-independent protein translocase protein TatB